MEIRKKPEKKYDLSASVWAGFEKAGRKIRKFFGKWQVQLLTVLIPFLMGVVGYIAYYGGAEIRKDFTVPLFSAIKLFTFGFDAKSDTGREWWYILLVIARWIALAITGSKLFQLLTPLNKKFFSVFKYHAVWKRCGSLLLIGNNEENRIIYQNAVEKDERACPMIVCSSEADFESLSGDGYSCVMRDCDEAVQSVINHILGSDNRECTLVINTGDEETNFRLSDAVVDCVRDLIGEDAAEIRRLEKEQNDRKKNGKELPEAGEAGVSQRITELKERTVRKLERLHAVVFGDTAYETAYQKMEQDSFGVLRYTNIYRKTAQDLISKYPLSVFIDRDRYIDAYGCIAGNLKINVVFVGFGDVNQELFTVSAGINQFVENGPGGVPRSKQVHYYVFDKTDARKNKNLNHMIFRFSREFLRELEEKTIRKEDYLEIPPEPAAVVFSETDVNDPAFYGRIREFCSGVPDVLNVISVGLGDDLENIDLAQKLADKVKEWALPDTHIFANVKRSENLRILQDTEHVIPFGCVKETALDPDNVFNSELEEIAREKHYMNALIKSKTDRKIPKTADEVRTDSLYEWHIYDPDEKMSSLYSILSLRSKLLMMGLDYRKKTGGPDTLKSNREYFDIYAADGGPELDPEYGKSFEQKDLYRYTKVLEKEDLAKQSLRQNLAVQEHLRWNAFMISRGFIPASLQKILSDRENLGKDYRLRTHGNLTTEEGLIDFRKIAVLLTGKTEAKADIINYDFHLMDDAWWYLNMFGYEIYKTSPVPGAEKS